MITPKFATSLKVSQPFYDKTEEGDFIRTMINMSAIEPRDLYTKRSYTVYTGGDFSLQVIENKLASENSATIVVVRDSFAATVTPFLALTSKSIHTIDLREYDNKRVESVSKYITDVHPDYVIILYTGVAKGDEKKFDFR